MNVTLSTIIESLSHIEIVFVSRWLMGHGSTFQSRWQIWPTITPAKPIFHVAMLSYPNILISLH